MGATATSTSDEKETLNPREMAEFGSREKSRSGAAERIGGGGAAEKNGGGGRRAAPRGSGGR